MNQVTTSSRQVFAFARDKGLPFHRWLSRVNPHTGVPTNSVYLTLVFTCLLALIIIGSPTAFTIILSLSATGLFTSYFVVIGTVLARRLRRQPFPASRFSLGFVGGNLINAAALCFLTLTFVFLFFPTGPSPNAASMNWNILVRSLGHTTLNNAKSIPDLRRGHHILRGILLLGRKEGVRWTDYVRSS